MQKGRRASICRDSGPKGARARPQKDHTAKQNFNQTKLSKFYLGAQILSTDLQFYFYENFKIFANF